MTERVSRQQRGFSYEIHNRQQENKRSREDGKQRLVIPAGVLVRLGDDIGRHSVDAEVRMELEVSTQTSIHPFDLLTSLATREMKA